MMKQLLARRCLVVFKSSRQGSILDFTLSNQKFLTDPFSLHLITQTIRKARESDPTRFDPSLDSAVGEYRGEALVERAIDPNDKEIPDYIQNPDSPRLDNFYRYRILYNRRVAP